jgi:hypothetical protein
MRAKNVYLRVLVATPVPMPTIRKSFLLLFFKKEALACFAQPPATSLKRR